MTFPPPTDDTTRARLARLAAPGFSYCLRCGMPWSRAREHSTPYAEGRSCFPLCEDCWVLLAHPEARIPYYGMLLDVWAAQGIHAEEIAEIRRGLTQSVAAGL